MSEQLAFALVLGALARSPIVPFTVEEDRALEEADACGYEDASRTVVHTLDGSIDVTELPGGHLMAWRRRPGSDLSDTVRLTSDEEYVARVGLAAQRAARERGAVVL